MKSTTGFHALSAALVALSLFDAVPAWAQWSRVLDVPASDIFSVYANGDTLAAGADTAVYVSTNAGATWKRSARVAAGVTEIHAVWVRNGRIYAGTFGQGVFVSDDLGDTWLDFNQGLVGGTFNTQLDIANLLVHGDSLYAATGGAGVWVRNIAAVGTWSHFGDLPGDTTSGLVDDVAASETRLVAGGGGNGSVYFRDIGAPGWTQNFLTGGFAAGLEAMAVAWTGHGWVVGSNGGLFRSATGQEPWTPTGPDLGILFHVSFADRGSDLFADLGISGGSVIAFSGDDGVNWQELENMTGVFIYRLAVSGNELYAGRLDGLWHRSIATVSVPEGSPARLQFAIAGSQPVGDQVRFRIDLPAPGPVVIEVFDVAGRRAADPIWRSSPAGPSEISWDARRLGRGIYLARLTAGSARAVVRLVRTR